MTTVDNREAMAYCVFREFYPKVTREQALRVVDEMAGVVVGLTAITRKPWKKRRRARGDRP